MDASLNKWCLTHSAGLKNHIPGGFRAYATAASNYGVKENDVDGDRKRSKTERWVVFDR